MSLLDVLILVVVVGAVLLLIRWAGSRLGAEPWVMQLAYGLVILIVAVYICRALGIFSLLERVRI